MSFRRFTALLIAVLGLSSPACGPASERRHAVIPVNVGKAPADLESQLSVGADELVKQITLLYRLYAGPRGFSREELTRVLAKYGGSADPVIVELAFASDLNADGRLTVHELLNGVTRALPALAWIPRGQKLGAETLLEAVRREYSDASAALQRRLARKLARFDRPGAGGNGDGALSRGEAALPAVFMKLFSSTQFPASVSAAAGSLRARILAQHMARQVFGRYASPDYGTLASQSVKLEWMIAGLDFLYANQVTHGKEGAGPSEAALEAVMALAESASGVALSDADRVERVLLDYDRAALGGDGDGRIDALEWIFAVTDLSYAAELLGRVGEVSATKPRPQFCVGGSEAPLGIPAGEVEDQCLYLLWHLTFVSPELGRGFFMDGAFSSKGAVYWDRLGLFDGLHAVAANDGRIDAVELGGAFARLRTVETVFLLLDTNADRKLNRTELAVLFESIGVTDAAAAAQLFLDAQGGAGGVAGLAALLGSSPQADLGSMGLADALLPILK